MTLDNRAADASTCYEYQVVHHSQFLEGLIDQGRLDVSEATLEERIVYHDSCYLGRHNDVYLAPRNVIGSLKGVQIIEAGRAVTFAPWRSV